MMMITITNAIINFIRTIIIINIISIKKSSIAKSFSKSFFKYLLLLSWKFLSFQSFWSQRSLPTKVWSSSSSSTSSSSFYHHHYLIIIIFLIYYIIFVTSIFKILITCKISLTLFIKSVVIITQSSSSPSYYNRQFHLKSYIYPHL
jgi:hypothetical protein